MLGSPAKMRRLGILSWLALGIGCFACIALYQGARAAFWEYRSARPRPHVVEKPIGDALLAAATDAIFQTKRGLRVRGWWMSGKNGAAVILSHGSGSDRLGMMGDARLLSGLGYGVLVYDHPGHGESDGPADWPTDIPDGLRAAIDWVQKQPNIGAGRIGALGFSLGTTSVARVAAEDPRLAAVVLEGAFTDADLQLLFEYRKWGPIQTIPGRWAMRACGMPEGSLRTIDYVGSIAPRPLLLIHGANDPVVPVAMASELFAAARQPKQLWIVPNAQHGDYAAVAATEYEERLEAFFASALLK